MSQELLKRLIRKTFIYDIVRYYRHGDLYVKYDRLGDLVPPSYEVKRLTILLYAKLFQIRTFIETGTFYGETVDAVKDEFDRVYSVELQAELHTLAKEKFAKFGHVAILFGDSSAVLPQILNQITVPSLFWLDGHYSTGNTAKGAKATPVMEELHHIFSDNIKDHVILIDDARHFTGMGDYPTLNQLRRYVSQRRPDCAFYVYHDIIRIHRLRSLVVS